MPNSHHTQPSIYPDPFVPPTTESFDPPSSAPSGEHPTYELLIEVIGELKEVTSPASTTAVPSTLQGSLRIFQGKHIVETPQPEDKPPTYHAFLSIQTVNIPLLSTHIASRLNFYPYRTFQLSIPDHVFHITLSERVEPELFDGFERILKWFCKWQSSDNRPEGAEPQVDASEFSTTERAIYKAGESGVRLVERIGSAINDGLTKHMSKRVENARSTQPRNVKIGGNVTSKTLSGTRTVVHKGAAIAAAASDKISEAVGKGIANNSISRDLREAPRGSTKRQFYDHLIAGLMTIGKVYVEADKQGRSIIQNVSSSAAELTGAKYGPEAETATRQLGSITLNGYRIMRFPQKLGATSLLKGAMKAKYGEQYVAAEMDLSQDYISTDTNDSAGHGYGRPYVANSHGADRSNDATNPTQ